jgi:esterase/lipase
MKVLLKVIFVGVVLTSCQTMLIKPYTNLETQLINGRNLYLTSSDNTDLLIFVNGSGMNSVLGEKKGNKWTSLEFPYFIFKVYKNLYDIAIPEKLDFSLGENFENDPIRLSNYTVDGLVTAYTQTIDEYLSKKEYNNVILFGISEGGFLLPKIYNALNNKGYIKKMIIWGAGGYSQAECFRILASSVISMPKGYRNECAKIDQIIDDVSSDPYSMTKYYLGWPYKRWNSFFGYQPIKEYSSINIPILFVQGKYDYSNPIESVTFIQENFKNKEYKYMYYDMGHIPDNEIEIEAILIDVSKWINE